MNTQKTHNLNIHMYSLDELLGLFDLSYDMSIEDLKRAKKKVLMLHPDKSKLSADYFLFYKKAFEIVVQFYENNHKQNQVLTEETTKYKPLSTNDHNKSTAQKVSSVVNEMGISNFQKQFNKLFEENMVTKKPDATKNEWFTKEEPIYDIREPVSTQNMGRILDTMKQKNNEIIRYQGVQEFSKGSGGANLYDEDEDEDETHTYISTDPFSKLKFDDLRKVHKDQTVFAVSERDIEKVPQYSGMDHFMRERGKQTLTPLEKQEAERMLLIRDKQFREKMMNKEYNASLKSMEYAEKNKTVLSNFLRLGN